MGTILNVYTSAPASLELATVLIHLQCSTGPRQIAVRPLIELPAPDIQRCQRLRAERAELLEAIAQTQHDLDCFHYGEWQPDAGRENGLRFDLQALETRLRGVEAVLGTGTGGLANGGATRLLPAETKPAG